MRDILPCPFCGRPPVVRRTMEEYLPDDNDPTEGGEYEIGVTICCTECGVEKSEEYRSEVVESWNKRALTSGQSEAGRS